MKNITIFCLTLNPEHEKLIKKLELVPVGLGKKEFSKNCLSDKSGDSISHKNPYYGEYTFHYWIWKNYLNKIQTDWVGFCQYRKFFVKNLVDVKNLKFNQLKKIIFNDVMSENENINSVLGSKFYVHNFKMSKIFKYHFKEFLFNPSLFFFKKKRNLKFHFDLFHGKGNLNSAIQLLDNEDKKEFKEFMENNVSFNPHNMFYCKKEILNKYYSKVFPWLEKCEEIFKFENFGNYGLQRIYGFLAERYLSYWFSKNTKYIEIPIIGKDLSDYKDL